MRRNGNGNGHTKGVDQQIFERQANICKAFANSTRLHLLDLLGHGEQTVADLQSELEVSKANLSQHLTILRSAGIVVTRRDGKRVICRVAMPEVKQACHLIRDVLRAQIREARDLAD